MSSKDEKINQLQQQVGALKSQRNKKFNVGDEVWADLGTGGFTEIESCIIVGEYIEIDALFPVFTLIRKEALGGLWFNHDHDNDKVIKMSGYSVHSTREEAIEAYNRKLEGKASNILARRIEL